MVNTVLSSGQNNGSISAVTVGMIFLGLNISLMALGFMGIMTGWFAFETIGYDTMALIMSIPLFISAVFAFRNDMVPESMIFMLVAVATSGFALMEYLSGSIPALVNVDVLFSIVSVIILIISVISRNVQVAAASMSLAVYFAGFPIGGDVGSWLVVIFGFLTFVICTACAVVNWASVQKSCGQ